MHFKASITLTPLYGPTLIGAGLRSRKQLKHSSVQNCCFPCWIHYCDKQIQITQVL